MDLVSLSDVKSRIGVEHTELDTVLQSFISEASALVENYLNRTLASAQYTEYFDGGPILSLSAYPVSEGTAAPILYESASIPRAFDTPVDSTTYALSPYRGIIEHLCGGFLAGTRTVKVVYTGGYPEIVTTAPDPDNPGGPDIVTHTGVLDLPLGMKLPILDQVAFMFKNRDNIGWTGQTAPDGGFSLQERWGLLSGVKAALKTYRRPSFAN